MPSGMDTIMCVAIITVAALAECTEQCEPSTLLHVVQSEAGLVAFLCSGHAGVILVLTIFICIAATPAYSQHDSQQEWFRASAMSKPQSHASGV